MTVSATLLGTMLHGVAASRPAANAVAGGTVYSATDTGAITQSDGSSWATWATISAGIADQGAFTFLDGTVASAPSTPASGKLRLYAKTGKVLAVKDDAGVETVFGAGGATVTRVVQTLTADVTMTTGNTVYDIISASFAAGTWDIWYKVLFIIGGATKTEYFCKLWDGTTVYDMSNDDALGVSSATYQKQVVGFAPGIVLGTTTTLKVSAKADQSASAASADNGTTGHFVTRMLGLKIT